MTRTATIISPRDHGRRMSLAEFDRAEGQEGYLYELGRGIITVTDIPKDQHGVQVHALRAQLYSYSATHPGLIRRIYTGAESKVLVQGYESERHPDLSIYKTPPPARGDEVWSMWVPEIVIEVVSPSSRHRDYVEKPEEYLAFGIHEYWIVDADQEQMTVMQRSAGQWKETIILSDQTHRTHLLPDFELDLAAVVRAANEA